MVAPTPASLDHLADAGRDRLIGELRQAHERMKADLEAMTRLQRLGSLFVREGNLEPVLAEIVAAAIAVSGADFGNIQLLDAESKDLKIVAHRGFPDWWLEFWNSVSKGQGVCGTALERGERVIVEDVERSPIFAGTPALEIQRRVGVRAVQSTPLVSRSGKPLGMFSTHWRRPGRPDDRSLRLLDLLGRQAADITERAQVEGALRQSEQKLRVSVAHAAIGFALATPDGRILEANPAYCAITGYGIEELRNMRFLEIVHPDDVVENTKHVERMLAGEFSDFVIENRYRRRGGDVIWARKSTSVVRDASGEPEWMISLVEDITGRKRAEGMLRSTLQRFYSVLSSMDNGVLLMTNEDTVEFVNLALCNLLRLKESPDELVGLSSSDMFGKLEHACLHRDKALARIKGIIRRGQPVKGEEISLRDGRTCLRDFVPLTVDGESRGRLWLHFDITERKRAEEDLRESEERFRLLVRGVRDCAIYMLAPDGTVTSWSAAAEQMFGYREEEIVGQHRGVLFTDEQRAAGRPQRGLEEALAIGSSEEEAWRVRKDGSRFWANALVTPLRDDAGNLRGFGNVTRDFTDRKRAENRLRESEERLRASESALREADRQKNQFLAMLSHELRNPLAPIRNSLYILDRAAPGGEQAKRAQAIIHRQIGQLTWLIDDLLDVTRIAHGKIELQRERLDLNELAHRAVEDHRAVFAKNELRLEVLPAPAEVWVDGDRVRLAQVVGNLLQNAAKFTPRGGKTTVSVESDLARRQATLTVRDTGAGIQPEMLPRLFQAFAQADATLDRSKGGLGLGLALVKGLVEMHGGSASAASDGPGKGATFTITLPLDVTAARILPAWPGPGVAAEPRRVLVIEDNEDAANTLREVLEFDEHVVEVAYTGREGLEKAHAFHPDVVLCDIGLPEMDGYEVARTMRADPELSHVALVAVSGYAQPEDVETAREAGFDAHLAKPPSIDTLERALAEVGNASRSAWLT